jgi:hypothetical protein
MQVLHVSPRLRRSFLPLLAALLVACSTPILAVDDAMRFEDGLARLVAFTQKRSGWILRGVEDVEVRFLVDGREVATSTTDERGFAKAVANVGREAQRFEATADFEGEIFRTEGELVSWRTDRVIIACDIDSTISNTSLNALFFHELDFVSQPIGSSPEVLREIANDYQIMYLTARPRFTLEKTRHWLSEHGYPEAPVLTSLSVGDVLSQTGYKTRMLRSLRRHYRNLLIGIGNTDIDLESYAAHDMLTLLVQPEAEVGHDGRVLRFQNWDQIGAFFDENRAVLADPRRLRGAMHGKEELVVRVTR